MWAFDVLELPYGAGEKDIKRAYARLLKHNRPDEHPEKFQTLNEAYQMALGILRSRVEREFQSLGEIPGTEANGSANDSRAEADGIEGNDRFTGQGLPSHEELILSWQIEGEEKEVLEPLGDEPFDPDGFASVCIAQAQASSPEALQIWLDQSPELWSLERKFVVAQSLVSKLEVASDLLHPMVANVLVRFFNLNFVFAGQAPLWLSYLEERARLDWELQEENWRHLALRLHGQGKSFKSWWQNALQLGGEWQVFHVISLMTQLCRTFSFMQVVLLALIPWRASELRELILGLDDGDVERLPPPINPQQVSFWLRAGDVKRFSWLRLQLGLLRGGLALLVVCILLLVLYGGMGRDFNVALGVLLIAVGTGFGLWLMYVVGQGILEWQRAPEALPTWSRLLRLLWVPLLFLSGMILHKNSAFMGSVLGQSLYILASILAITRYAYRNSVPVWVQVWRKLTSSLWVMPVVLFFLASVWLVLQHANFERVLYAFAFGYWVLDVWKQRLAIGEWFRLGRQAR